MVQPGHWFDKAEYAARVDRVRVALAEQGLDALVAVQPETVTWLTGFFTRGYGSFQCSIIPADGEPVTVCRDVEEYYLETTSVFPDRALWSDGDDPVTVAAGAVAARVGRSPQLAVERNAWPLSAGRFDALAAALPGTVWRDWSSRTASMRLRKSAAEIAMQRRAGIAAEAGMRSAIDAVGVGVSERELAAEICSAMIRAGSDAPGPGVLSSGERAFHLHGGYSDRVLERGDPVQVEVTPCVNHYHARFMRPILVGAATSEHYRTVERLIEIQDAALAEVRAGVPAAVPDRIYRDGVLGAGLREQYTNKTFYSVGLLLPPSGGEPLEADPGCSWDFEAGQTFHTYVLAQGFGMSETIAVTESGIDRLTRFPRELFVR